MEIHLNKKERFIYYAQHKKKPSPCSKSVHWSLPATIFWSVTTREEFPETNVIDSFSSQG